MSPCSVSALLLYFCAIQRWARPAGTTTLIRPRRLLRRGRHRRSAGGSAVVLVLDLLEVFCSHPDVDAFPHGLFANEPRNVCDSVTSQQPGQVGDFQHTDRKDHRGASRNENLAVARRTRDKKPLAGVDADQGPLLCDQPASVVVGRRDVGAGQPCPACTNDSWLKLVVRHEVACDEWNSSKEGRLMSTT
jgi:hypothetical protein